MKMLVNIITTLNAGLCVQKKLFSSLNNALACQLISLLLSPAKPPLSHTR